MLGCIIAKCFISQGELSDCNLTFDCCIEGSQYTTTAFAQDRRYREKNPVRGDSNFGGDQQLDPALKKRLCKSDLLLEFSRKLFASGDDLD